MRARIEVLDHEILAISPKDDARIDRCVEEALWSVRLDRRSDPGFAARAVFEVDVTAAAASIDDDDEEQGEREDESEGDDGLVE